MKARNKLIAVVVALGAITTAYAAGAGTSNDPIVTKSYVDQKIAEISKQIAGLGGTSTNASMDTYKVITLDPGQMLIGKQGTEIIMRSGEGFIVASSNGGVQDITGGVDLGDGKAVPKYHLLLIPREDGRGIVATKAMYVMVRGSYTIQ